MSESLRRSEKKFLGPPVVLFLRVGQGNMYSEATGQMNCDLSASERQEFIVN